MRERNMPGVPAPGADYTASIGMTAEERAELSVAEIAAQKAAEITGAQKQQAGNGETVKDFAAALASHMAELVGVASGGGRKQIAPAVLRERKEAWARMEELLAEYRESGDTPIYELTAPLFCDDVLIPATRQEGRGTVATRIQFGDIPNEQMIPRNDPAKKVFELYLRAIGGKTPDLGDQSYEAYLNRPRVAQVIGEPLEAPLLGSPGQVHQARAVVLEDTPAEERRYVGPKKQLGTLQPEVHGAF